MREITEKWLEHERKEIDRLYRDGAVIGKGIYEVRVPPALLWSFQKRARRFALDDVEDVMTHYDMLSSYRMYPPSFVEKYLRWARKHAEKLSYNLQYTRDPDHARLAKSSKRFGIVLTTAEMDNVYLRDITVLKKPTFDASEFTVVDNDNRSIRGSFVYTHRPQMFGDDEDRKQMAMVLDAPDHATFDIGFTVLPRSYFFGEKKTREPMLNVHDIRRRLGDEEDAEVPCIPDDVPEPFLQPV